jgi:hypothetical protein
VPEQNCQNDFESILPCSYFLKSLFYPISLLFNEIPEQLKVLYYTLLSEVCYCSRCVAVWGVLLSDVCYCLRCVTVWGVLLFTVGTAVGVLGCCIRLWFPGTSDKPALGCVHSVSGLNTVHVLCVSAPDGQQPSAPPREFRRHSKMPWRPPARRPITASMPHIAPRSSFPFLASSWQTIPVTLLSV